MTESKVFRLVDGVDSNSVGKEVENFLRNEKKLTTEGTKTPDGYFVQAKEPEEVSWKKLAGMTMAIQIQIVQINDTITVNIGNGKWSDKIGAGAVGVVLFAPLAVTAAIGAYNQKKLPEEIFAHIEKFILGGGKSIVVGSFGSISAKENEVFCPQCNAINNNTSKFCESCGASLSATCPECGASVPLDTKFCSECGSSMEVVEEGKTCPECGAVVAADMKFCGECGTPIPEDEPDKTCPECGAVVGENMKFCGECGTPIPEDEVDKTCPECGAVVPADMKFCGECGTKME